MTSHMMNEVENEIQTMQNEIRTLRALCHDTQRTMHPDDLRELDLERLMKELVYDMEDIVEYVFIRMEDAMTRNIIVRKLLIEELGSWLKWGIKSFKESRLEPINRRIQAYLDLRVQQIEADQVYL